MADNISQTVSYSEALASHISPITQVEDANLLLEVIGANSLDPISATTSGVDYVLLHRIKTFPETLSHRGNKKQVLASNSERTYDLAKRRLGYRNIVESPSPLDVAIVFSKALGSMDPRYFEGLEYPEGREVFNREEVHLDTLHNLGIEFDSIGLGDDLKDSLRQEAMNEALVEGREPWMWAVTSEFPNLEAEIYKIGPNKCMREMDRLKEQFEKTVVAATNLYAKEIGFLADKKVNEKVFHIRASVLWSNLIYAPNNVDKMGAFQHGLDVLEKKYKISRQLIGQYFEKLLRGDLKTKYEMERSEESRGDIIYTKSKVQELIDLIRLIGSDSLRVT